MFPNAPGCPAAGSNQALNSVMLKIRVRVPTNAKSFNVQMYFMSSEWPEWTCTPYNDMFDPADVPDCTCQENLEKPTGRGIMLIRAYMDEVQAAIALHEAQAEYKAGK